MYPYTNSKQDLRRESKTAFAKTHAQLHRRQQLAREVGAVRVATEERAANVSPAVSELSLIHI